MSISYSISYFLAIVLTISPGVALRADWPQFQGPQRNGHSQETGLLKSWGEEGPPRVWTNREIGLGYSSPAVVGDRLVISGARGESELLICLNSQTGEELWTSVIGPKFDFEGNSWGAGPRATPCIYQPESGGTNHVYALGGTGNLVCAELGSGRIVWQKHMMDDLGGEVNPIGGGPGTKPGEKKIGWGYSWSPLVDQNQLICFPGGAGGAVAALSPMNGEVLWRSTDLQAQASYASIIPAEIEGMRQYIVLHNEGLTGISSTDGAVLWKWEKTYSDVVIPSPIYVDGHVYVSAGSSPSTCALVQISREGQNFTAEMLYSSRSTRVMKNQVGGSVIVDGNVYGYSDKVGWVCQDLMSGTQRWAARNPLKAGSVITADGMLYCYDEENGLVALVEANPDKFVLRSQFNLPEETSMKSPSGRNWTPLVIANGHLFVRDQEILFCYRLSQQ